MKKPRILTEGHTLTAPALEWTDGHILGNGDLGAVLWGTAENLCFGLSKHDLYNLESPYEHSGNNQFTYLEMLERFKREGRACIPDNPEIPGKPCKFGPRARRTPLTAGTLELKMLTGVNVLRFEQTLKPYEGEAAVTVEPVDRRRSYGQQYPTVFVRACVDSETNALAVRLSCTPGDEVKLCWSYTWPQHILDGYETAFETLSDAHGRFHAVIGEGNEFTAEIVQAGGATRLAASALGLSGVARIASDCPADILITVHTTFEGDAPACDANMETIFARTNAWWHAFWGKSMVWYDEPVINDQWAMGLYALGASTRPEKSAPNLQGIWNLSPEAIWHSDFHFNTNVQECHWAAGPSNHPELSRALVRMLTKDWREELRLYAKRGYGVDGAVALGVGMDWRGRSLDGWWSTASLSNTAWTALSVWEHYQFDPDEDMLRQDIFPFLKECCALYDGVMEWENGAYVTRLSASPERTVPGKDGKHYSLYGKNCTICVSTIRALFEAAAKAARVLGEDDEHFAFVAAHMPPLPTQDGVLIEMETGYFEDGDRPGVTKECHRHPSRLMPIFPAGQIGLNGDAETVRLGVDSFHDFLADGMKSFAGWSFPYLANIAARVGLGTEAEHLLLERNRRFSLRGLLSAHNALDEGAYDNALFQIEALLAVPAAVDEMLLQSVDGVIRVFPAVPTGRDCAFEHLRARGNVLVSASRMGGVTEFVELTPTRDGEIRLVSPWDGREIEFEGQAGKTYRFDRP